MITLPASESATSSAAHAPSIIVLGADTLLAAEPATPVQLAHACLKAGYSNVVPASWGDELVATAVLRELNQRPTGPAVQCSCPLVVQRLSSAGSELQPFFVNVVSPPAAVARYVRALYPTAGVRITYAGRCPGAADSSVDIRVKPEELLAALAASGISLDAQPQVFDSVIPPDRRRFHSVPGGVPTAAALWSEAGGRTLAELDGHDLSTDLAQHLLSGTVVLVDAAASVGCFCAGATPGGDACLGRDKLMHLEPPRAPGAVIDEHAPVDLSVPAQTVAPAPDPLRLNDVAGAEAVGPRSAAPMPPLFESVSGAVSRMSAPESDPLPEPVFVSDIARAPRRSPVHGIRPVLGSTPVARSPEGRQLPRTYVARRRSSPRGVLVQLDEPENSPPAEVQPEVAPDASPIPAAVENVVSAPEPEPAAVAVEAPKTAPEPEPVAAKPATDKPPERTAANTHEHQPRPSQNSVPGAEVRRTPRPSAPVIRPTPRPTPRPNSGERTSAGADLSPTLVRSTISHLTAFAVVIAILVLGSVALGILAGRWIFGP